MDTHTSDIAFWLNLKNSQNHMNKSCSVCPTDLHIHKKCTRIEKCLGKNHDHSIHICLYSEDMTSMKSDRIRLFVSMFYSSMYSHESKTDITAHFLASISSNEGADLSIDCIEYSLDSKQTHPGRWCTLWFLLHQLYSTRNLRQTPPTLP